MEYRTVYQGGKGEIVEKKVPVYRGSIFWCTRRRKPCSIWNRYGKSTGMQRHHCWAYVIGEERVTERCSDDGEPSGTAGKPILEVIRGAGLHNIFVVVTRYFGGTLLGTGGLVRAYTESAREGISHSQIITKIYGFKLNLTTDYTGLGKIQYLLGQRGLTILDSVYTEKVDLTVLIPKEEESKLIAEITEATNGQTGITRTGECWFANVDGEMVVFE